MATSLPSESTTLLGKTTASSEARHESRYNRIGVVVLLCIFVFWTGGVALFAFFVSFVLMDLDHVPVAYLICIATSLPAIAIGNLCAYGYFRHYYGFINEPRGALFKTTIPREQWIVFHFWDSNRNAGFALLYVVLIFVAFVVVYAIIAGLKSIGSRFDAETYAFAVLVTFFAFFLSFVIYSSWILIRRRYVLKSENTSVYFYRSSIRYNGFFESWQWLKETPVPETLYFQSAELTRNKTEAGCVLEVITSKITKKNEKEVHSNFVPIAESDFEAVKEVLRKYWPVPITVTDIA